MSGLRTALDAILAVEFRTIVPREAEKIGDFLEKAAHEISEREGAVTEREIAVSKREAACTLREDNIEAEMRAIKSLNNVKRALSQAPVAEVKRWGWRRG